MRLIAPKDLEARFGIKLSPAQRNRLIKANRFPRPIRLNGGDRGITAFIEEELIEYVEQRRAERDGKKRAA